MRRTSRSLFAAAVLSGLLLSLPVTAQAAATSDPAQAAAGWLARQVDSSGLIAGQSGPDRNVTALAVLALGSVDRGGPAARRAVEALAGNVDASVKDSQGNDRPGALGTLIQAAVVTGRDPRAFGGVDLVARLAATKRGTGTDAGLYGVQDPKFDGAYRQSLALLGLAAVGMTDADAVAWLRGQQCPDGGWEAYRADESAPCTPTNAAAFAGEDTNSTAIAAQALAALAAPPSVSPLGFLDAAQNSDGGFGFLAGTSTDANSTALSMQAIIAFGEDPTAGRWSDAQGDNPLTALLMLRLGCSSAEPSRGAFAYQPETDGSLSPNALATVQVVPALARDPYPIGRATFTDEEPTLSCPRAQQGSPTPSPASSSSSTGAPSPRASVAPSAASTPPTLVVDDFGDTLPDTGPGQGSDIGRLALHALGLLSFGCAALVAASSLAATRGAGRAQD